jgi:hypothetical protein
MTPSVCGWGEPGVQGLPLKQCPQRYIVAGEPVDDLQRISRLRHHGSPGNQAGLNVRLAGRKRISTLLSSATAIRLSIASE